MSRTPLIICHGDMRRLQHLRSYRWLNRHVLTKPLLELNNAINEREEREVAARADVCTSMVRGATLTNEDVACANNLTAELLYAEALATTVSSVPGTSYCFFMCHDVT